MIILKIKNKTNMFGCFYNLMNFGINYFASNPCLYDIMTYICIMCITNLIILCFSLNRRTIRRLMRLILPYNIVILPYVDLRFHDTLVYFLHVKNAIVCPMLMFNMKLKLKPLKKYFI